MKSDNKLSEELSRDLFTVFLTLVLCLTIALGVVTLTRACNQAFNPTCTTPTCTQERTND